MNTRLTLEQKATAAKAMLNALNTSPAFNPPVAGMTAEKRRLLRGFLTGLGLTESEADLVAIGLEAQE